jgi:GLPGLI family protein
MKKALSLILRFSTFSVFSQNSNSNCGMVSYEYKLSGDHVVIKKSNLYFNDTLSKFIFNKYENGQNPDNQFETDGMSAHVSIPSGDEQGNVVYRNFKSETILNREAKMGNIFEAFTIDDYWIKINWDIQNDTMRIGKFLCHKAVGDFRGRTYIVWFTEEIPFPYGPWKLFGLPGLILEAEDSKHLLKVTFESINYPYSCSESDLVVPTANENKTLKEYVEFKDNFNENLVNKLRSKLPRNSGVTLGYGPKPKNIRKYRVEKQYEWEN